MGFVFRWIAIVTTVRSLASAMRVLKATYAQSENVEMDAKIKEPVVWTGSARASATPRLVSRVNSVRLRRAQRTARTVGTAVDTARVQVRQASSTANVRRVTRGKRARLAAMRNSNASKFANVITAMAKASASTSLRLRLSKMWCNSLPQSNTLMSARCAAILLPRAAQSRVMIARVNAKTVFRVTT